MEFVYGIEYYPEIYDEYHKLPTFEFTKDDIEYTVSDLGLLEKTGVDCLETCIQQMGKNKNTTECRFECNQMLKWKDIRIAIDIILGFCIKATSKNANTDWHSIDMCMATSARVDTEEGNRRVLVIEMSETFNKLVYDYWHSEKEDLFDVYSRKNDTFDICDFAVYAAGKIDKSTVK